MLAQMFSWVIISIKKRNSEFGFESSSSSLNVPHSFPPCILMLRLLSMDFEVKEMFLNEENPVHSSAHLGS